MSLFGIVTAMRLRFFLVIGLLLEYLKPRLLMCHALGQVLTLFLLKFLLFPADPLTLLLDARVAVEQILDRVTTTVSCQEKLFFRQFEPYDVTNG